MSGTSSSGPSGFPGDHSGLEPETASIFAVGFAGEQKSPTSSLTKETGRTVFVETSTNGVVTPSPTQGGSQESSEEAPKKQVKENSAQMITDQVEAGLKMLQENKLSPFVLCKNMSEILTNTRYNNQKRLSLILELFKKILQSLGDPLYQSASEIDSCDLSLVKFFIRIFDPTTVRIFDPTTVTGKDSEFEIARLLWWRAFEHPDPNFYMNIPWVTFNFLKEQEKMQIPFGAGIGGCGGH
jgi:hypothetical protein